MLPYLLEWRWSSHTLRLPTYGVLAAAAFLCGYLVSLWLAPKLKLAERTVEDLFLRVVLASLVGSRLFHIVVEEPRYYLAHPWRSLFVWEGGYTLYGALITSLVAIFVYCRRNHVPFLTCLDMATPGAALGIAVGRLGCLAAGCCWGRPTVLPWGVRFSHPYMAGVPVGVPLHPTQAYESLGALVIVALTLWRASKDPKPGSMFLWGLTSYAALRFVIEIFRGDDYRGLWFSGLLSTSQIISLAFLIPAPAAFFWVKRKGAHSPI